MVFLVHQREIMVSIEHTGTRLYSEGFTNQMYIHRRLERQFTVCYNLLTSSSEASACLPSEGSRVLPSAWTKAWISMTPSVQIIGTYVDTCWCGNGRFAHAYITIRGMSCWRKIQNYASTMEYHLSAAARLFVR